MSVSYLALHLWKRNSTKKIHILKKKKDQPVWIFTDILGVPKFNLVGLCKKRALKMTKTLSYPLCLAFHKSLLLNNGFLKSQTEGLIYFYSPGKLAFSVKVSSHSKSFKKCYCVWRYLEVFNYWFFCNE